MKTILLAAAFAAALTPARAEEPSGGVEFFQSTLSEIMDTPMLAASYAEERPSDAAAAAYVVTAETIDKRGYRTLSDLLGDMPQFQLQRNSDVRRLNLVSVRGIPGNERLLVLYDGVRITPPTGDLFAIADQLSLRNAERVEVVLGPMSAVYGADAFSGVVNVVTGSAGHDEAGASYGSFSSRSAGLSARSRLAGKAPGSPYASVTFEAGGSAGPKLPDQYRDDYAWYNGRYQAGEAQLSPYNASTTTVPVLRYDARETSSYLNARMRLRNLEVGLIKMKESHSSSIGVKPELTLYSEDARFSTGQWTLYGRHSFSAPGENWKVVTTAGYYDYEIAPESRFLNSFSGYDDAYKYASAKSAYMEQTFSFDAAEGLPVLLGYSYQENSALPYTADLDHKFDTTKSPLSQDFVYNGSTIPVDFYSLRYSNTGAFMRVQKNLGDLSLSMGLRYDRNTRYGETWNPRAGLVWRPGGSDRTVLKVLCGEAYLAPSPFWTNKHFGSFVSSPTAASGYHSYFFHIPNEDLDPEKLRSLEASLSHDFGHRLRLTLNPYYNKVEDLIQDVTMGPGMFKGVEVDTLEQAANTGTMETYGATLRADAVLQAGRWSLEPWAAYTYSEGRLAGDQIPFNSRHVIQTGLSALHGRWAFTPKFVSRSYTRNQDGTRAGGFVTADLYLRYSASRASGFSGWLDLRNIFDRRYYNAAYGGGADHMAGAPQDPFGATAGVSYKF
ncbi:MAG: TonB-dependent receptor plug domain-containing protein [Elusimicrobiales bacterium]